MMKPLIQLEWYKITPKVKAIKQGNSVSLGWLHFEDDIPIGTLTRLQQEFWKVLKDDNFHTIEDDLRF